MLTRVWLLYTFSRMPRITDIARVTQGLSTFGRGAGVRPGEWELRMVESSDLGDNCWVDLDDLKEFQVDLSERTERHLLRPFDVLVTARTGYVQAGLVPRAVTRTVASVMLLVVRPHNGDRAMGLYIWYFLTSAWGQAQMKRRLTVSPTITSLSASNLGEVELPIPSPRQMDQIADLIEASNDAYKWTVETARLRQDEIRDSIIGEMYPTPEPHD